MEIQQKTIDDILDTSDALTQDFFNMLNSQEISSGAVVILSLARVLFQTAKICGISDEEILNQFTKMYNLVESSTGDEEPLSH